MIYLGIDPGKSGALAWEDTTTGRVKVVPMPATDTDLLFQIGRAHV